MTTPEGPAHGHPPEHPADRPEWGRPPAGGWGDPSRAAGPDPAGAVGPSQADYDPGPGGHGPRWASEAWGSETGRAETGPSGSGDVGRPESPGPEAGSTRLDETGWGTGPVQPGPWGPPPPAWGAPPPRWPNSPGPGPQGPNSAGPGPQGPDAPWAGAQVPAWAQQPPPGGGWAGAQQGSGGWSGPPPNADAPYPGGHYDARQWGPADYPPLPGATRRPERPRTPLIVTGVLVALLAVGAVLAFVAPGFLRPVVFDQAALQTGVQRVLVDSYRITGVGEVLCGDPAQGPIRVRTGDVFTCSTTVGGAPVTVSVTITSGSGDYEVSTPE